MKTQKLKVSEIRQIAYECGLWAIDVEMLRQFQRKFPDDEKKPSSVYFKEKFDKWIENRIQLSLDKLNN